MTRRTHAIVAAAMMIAVHGMTPSSIARAEEPAPVDVSVCALLTRPLDFENTHVRVRGTVVVGPESFALVDASCSSNTTLFDQVWLDQPEDDHLGKYSRGWSGADYMRALASGQLSGSGPETSWQIPLPVGPLNRKRLHRLYRAIDENDCPQADAIITGRFDFAGGGLLVLSRRGSYELVGGFGHLSGFERRIVMEDVRVVREQCHCCRP
jgi:hypothetical protein